MAVLMSALASSHADTLVYENSFDGGDAALSGFAQFGSGVVQVSNGELAIQPTSFEPAGVTRRMDSLAPVYPRVLAESSGIITWSANFANQDGRFNHGVELILACNSPSPFQISSVGYALRGGSMVGDRMVLYSFDFGMGGGGREVVVIPSEAGLGVLPERGSFRVTYNPANQEWRVFGEVGNAYVDPRSVATELGRGVDSAHTGKALPYFGLGSKGDGKAYFDDVAVEVVPEPTVWQLVLAGVIVRLGWGGQLRTAPLSGFFRT
jgi:hypothetical protein